MQFKRQSKADVDINLTPLIDVVFLLLIFFMVSTTFTKESHLTLTLPEAQGEPNADVPVPIEVVINAAGEYVINDQRLVNSELDTLKAALSKLSDGDASFPVVITADANCPHQAVVRAMDAAGQLGFVRLSLTTIQPPQSR